MKLFVVLLAFVGVVLGSPVPNADGDLPQPVPVFRKLQVKMAIDYCSKNVVSELEPCKAALFHETIKGLPSDEKKKKIVEAIASLETKKKKKMAHAMHDDMMTIYTQFCSAERTGWAIDVCKNEELKDFLEKPLAASAYFFRNSHKSSGTGYSAQGYSE